MPSYQIESVKIKYYIRILILVLSLAHTLLVFSAKNTYNSTKTQEYGWIDVF